jgi:hypothetical protein
LNKGTENKYNSLTHIYWTSHYFSIQLDHYSTHWQLLLAHPWWWKRDILHHHMHSMSRWLSFHDWHGCLRMLHIFYLQSTIHNQILPTPIIISIKRTIHASTWLKQSWWFIIYCIDISILPWEWEERKRYVKLSHCYKGYLKQKIIQTSRIAMATEWINESIVPYHW